ncbi:PAS domain S-box protein [Methanobacterium oryzae]|uniref:PAS domain S-box protein n=1 Tax=Methanobacterium oryzae TaxID=69540 RepID=UPI003D23914F
MEGKFKEIFEKSPIGILFLDKEGKITDANQSTLEIMGYASLDDILGLNMFNDPYIAPKKDELLEKGNIKIQSPIDFDNIKKSGIYNPTRSGTAFLDLTISVINSGFLAQIQDITEEKKAKDAEERLEALMENNPSLIFMKDESGKYVYLNKSYKKQFVHSKDWYGKTDFDFWPKESAELFQANDAEVLKSGKIHQFKEDSTDPNGIRYVWLNYKFPFTDTKGNKYVGGIGIDTTDRVVAEEALKVSETQLKTIIENLEEGLVVSDIDGNFTHWNPAAIKMHGFSSIEEGIRKFPEFADIFELSTKDGNVLSVDQWPVARVLRGEHLTDFEAHIKRINSNWERVFNYRGTLVRNAQEQPLMAVITLTDITERKKAERERKNLYDAIELEKEQLSTLINNIPDEVWVADANKKVTLVNPAVTKEFKDTFNEEEIEKVASKFDVYKSDYTPRPPEEAPPLRALNGEIVKNEEEIVKTPASSELRYRQVNASPIKDNKGHITGSISIVRDITELKKTEEALKHSHDNLELKVEERTAELEEAYQYLKENEVKLKDTITALEQSNRELRSFAYITSHDLQEPLRTVASFTQLLKRRYKGKFDSDADEFMDYTVEASKRMKDMIQGLLEYSRIDRKIEFVETDMNVKVEKAISNLHTAIEESEAEITYDNLPTVYADPDQMVRVFQNFIGNAIKFKKPQFPPRIHISAKEDRKNNEWVFSVEDNGIGMEQQYTGKIFEVFRRLHTIDVYEGTGIGLAIIKRIIERQGGRIWVESELGVGSAFYFTIPIKNE